ncbi:divalent metal cation transporter [Alteromonas aestuariivivens]|uniref:Divalent metal cation transporter n=1 Tax=Alteromonas aestuariivivens TaxID=1938339 RepID=A0A3D8MEM6_9ALTE|nr:Nramp family divalent metal transporter [Alteromonas aestuariivivens]RDV28964.1 divalent metal cation transporter [Alteromonas aestuariivivens]
MAKDKSGFIIAAAFIGPGTITTASVAGADFGFHLVWALLFSVVATIVLQDMAVRLGVTTGEGLSANLKSLVTRNWLRWLFSALIVAAIGIGNAAYESGNLTGAAIGLNSFLDIGVGSWAVVLGGLAAVLLWSGHYQLIESVLVWLVFAMAAVFLLTLAVSQPNLGELLYQLTHPRLDDASITPILALIGTTIVPYNLFLHASLVARHHTPGNTAEAISECRRQSAQAISLGGFITVVVVATASMAFYKQAIELDASNMGQQLAPVLGDWAQWFFAAGLFAAGLTSAITAPLAGAYAVCGALNQPSDLRSAPFRLVWMSIIGVGVAIAAAGFKPIVAILFAQATNGLLLPIIAVFLLLVMNRNQQLGPFRNGPFSNLLGTLVVGFILLLASYKLWQLFST